MNVSQFPGFSSTISTPIGGGGGGGVQDPLRASSADAPFSLNIPPNSSNLSPNYYVNKTGLWSSPDDESPYLRPDLEQTNPLLNSNLINSSTRADPTSITSTQTWISTMAQLMGLPTTTESPPNLHSQIEPPPPPETEPLHQPLGLRWFIEIVESSTQDLTSPESEDNESFFPNITDGGCT